jgi:hypothetical protein
VIRLTVLYELPAGADEEDFLRWRLGEHQRSNMSIPGVVRSEFHKILSVERGTVPRFSYMTTVDWPDEQAFKQGFYDRDVQTKLEQDLKRIENPTFLVSEILTGDERKDAQD